jgi:hypothetical protein
MHVHVHISWASGGPHTAAAGVGPAMQSTSRCCAGASSPPHRAHSLFASSGRFAWHGKPFVNCPGADEGAPQTEPCCLLSPPSPSQTSGQLSRHVTPPCAMCFIAAG